MPRTRGWTPNGTVDSASLKVRLPELLDGAAKVFYERGYAASSVQMIADELGILKGSLYHYIRSKEELLFRLLDGVHVQLGALLDEAKASTAADPLERLHVYVRQQVEYAASHGREIAIYYRDVDQLPEQYRSEIFARRRQHKDFVCEILAEAQAAGTVRTDDSALVLAQLIFGSFIWTYRWYDPTGLLSPAQLAEACARFALRAIRA